MQNGKDDTRFLVRGRIDWEDLDENLKDENSFHFKVKSLISHMLNERKGIKAFGRGNTEFLDLGDERLLAYHRIYNDENVVVINNLSSSAMAINNPFTDKDMAVIMPNGFSFDQSSERLLFEPHGFVWLRIL